MRPLYYLSILLIAILSKNTHVRAGDNSVKWFSELGNMPLALLTVAYPSCRFVQDLL